MKRGRDKPKSSPRSIRNHPSAGPARSNPPPALAPGRKWLFRLIGLFLLPLLVFVLLEGGLRLAGYGYHTGFFDRIRVGQRDVLVNNEDFSLRFFPPQLARWPGPIQMDARKPAGAYRIFVLGESAARGEPVPSCGAARYLQTLLRERFPAGNFEVVNVAITAINSHVILPIARDCARQEGDLWIIYMGNNEMVGPFGAATVFGVHAPPLWAVRLNLAVQKTRVGQLLMALRRRLQGKAANASWGGMSMFLGNQLPPDDPGREIVYRSFQQNLRDIVRTGQKAGCKIILNTVAVNLRDCPPIASMPGTNLSAAQRAQFDQIYTDARLAEEQGRFREAAQGFEQAAKLDASVPDLQFHWANCLLRLTNSVAAREHFQQACDLDALPFRATGRINDIIRQTGRQMAGPGLVLFDAADAMAAGSPAGVPGEETFYEHVHFNFDGNYRLGLAWAEQVEGLLPPAIKRGAASEWASQELCERRLGLTDWNRCLIVESVISRLHRPPLSSQFNNSQRLAALQREETELRHRMNAATASAARETYVDALKRNPGDHYLHENFAEFLESIGDVSQAAAEWRQVCALLPKGCFGCYQVGRLLEDQGQAAEAELFLSRAVALRPSLAEAWFELGNIHLVAGNFEAALTELNRACRLEPRNANYWAFAGKALAKLKRRAEAIQDYRQALELNPDLSEARLALADELVADNRLVEATAEYTEVTRQQPTNAVAHIDLGVLFARQGRFDDALREFDETLRLEPENKIAREYRERVQGWKNNRR